MQPLLRLLFGEDHDEDVSKIPWTSRHEFLNISITPIECSVICSRQLADRFFQPLANLFHQLLATDVNDRGKKQIEISVDDYMVVQVEGQGLDAGQRVLELTSPLALAGMSVSSNPSQNRQGLISTAEVCSSLPRISLITFLSQHRHGTQ